MIKKKIYWILMLTAICILAVTGCKKEGKTADFHIYYTDSEGVSLVEKGIKPEGKTQKEQIDEILDKIQKNTDDIDYRSPFVKEVKVKEWSVKDGKLIVDFNRNYQKLSATGKRFCCALRLFSLSDRFLEWMLCYSRSTENHCKI